MMRWLSCVKSCYISWRIFFVVVWATPTRQISVYFFELFGNRLTTHPFLNSFAAFVANAWKTLISPEFLGVAVTSGRAVERASACRAVKIDLHCCVRLGDNF
jgi:hypothetical protein